MQLFNDAGNASDASTSKREVPRNFAADSLGFAFGFISGLRALKDSSAIFSQVPLTLAFIGGCKEIVFVPQSADRFGLASDST